LFCVFFSFVNSDSSDRDVASVIADMEEEMLEAARQLQFEKAAMIRDQIETLQSGQHGGGSLGAAKSKPKRKRKSKAVYNAKGLPRRR
jgi:excinuclease ABC subunit B